MMKIHAGLAGLVLAAASAAVHAQAPAPLAVAEPWARAVLQGQSSSAAYMTLTAREPLTLLGASSPAAGVVELHEMRMDGEVMRMRAIDALPLPAGQAVALRPGGHHFMLMDLKAQFKPGLRVPLTLRLRDARGAERTLEVALPVAAAAPAASAGHKH